MPFAWVAVMASAFSPSQETDSPPLFPVRRDINETLEHDRDVYENLWPNFRFHLQFRQTPLPSRVGSSVSSATPSADPSTPGSPALPAMEAPIIAVGVINIDPASQMEYGRPASAYSNAMSEASDSINFFNTDSIDNIPQPAFDITAAKNVILKLKDQGVKVMSEIQEKASKVTKLESDLRDQDTMLMKVETAMFQFNGEVESKERKVNGLMEEHLVSLSRASETKELADRIHASKLEIQLCDAKKDFAEIHMKLLQLEADLQPQKDLCTGLKLELAMEREVLSILEKELAALKEEFKEKCAAIPILPLDTSSVHLQSRLSTAEDIIDEQVTQIKEQEERIKDLEKQLANNFIVQESQFDSSKSDTQAGSTKSYGTQFSSGHDEDNIQALQARIAELELDNQSLNIFRQFAVDIRARKYEFDIKGRPKDQIIIGKGENGIRLASVAIDTMLFTDPANKIPANEFEANYHGVPAAVVREHMEFTMFLDILNWGSNMKRFGKFYNTGNQNSPFVVNFNNLFKRIYPTFQVDSNEAILQDPELKYAYDTMSTEYSTAYWAWVHNYRGHVTASTSRTVSTSK